MTLNAALEAWLDKRGLDPELAEKMGWTGDFHRELGPSVRIPFVRDGKTATSQFRSLERKEFRFASGSSVELWNADCLRDDAGLDSAPIVMAEGACDGLALVQCGFLRTVAVPGWSDKNTDPNDYEPFKRNEAAINRAPVVIVAQHDDNAGAAMLRAVANFFPERDVRYVKWPKGCKDANDTLLLHGQEAVVAAVNAARRVDPPGGLITGFTDLPPRPERRMWKLNWDRFDRLVAFRSREISVLTGTPGSGKTTFMTWACHHLVEQHGIRIGLGLFETDPAEVYAHLFRLHTATSPGDPTLSPEQARYVRGKLDKHYRLFHRVEDADDVHDMGWLKKMIHTLAARDGCNMIVIDPWNELEHLLEKGESFAQYANFALMRLRQWADRYDIHICIVAHPKKMEPGRKPIGYDIADAAAFANKPGMGWTIHLEPRKKNKQGDDIPEHVSLTAWKVRNRQASGCQPGVLRMDFDEQSMVYRPK